MVTIDNKEVSPEFYRFLRTLCLSTVAAHTDVIGILPDNERYRQETIHLQRDTAYTILRMLDGATDVSEATVDMAGYQVIVVINGQRLSDRYVESLRIFVGGELFCKQTEGPSDEEAEDKKERDRYFEFCREFIKILLPKQNKG
jgi:hypothetical protein